MSVSLGRKSRLVVLISGGGSNLQALINSCHQGKINADIVGVISNVADVKGLQRAADANITATVVNHLDFQNRHEFDQQLAAEINLFNPDLVVLAGFMRILTPEFVDQFMGRMINIHPSLLPKYTGLNTHQRAIDAGDKIAGATVHFVTPELDGGPQILQGQVDISDRDTSVSLASKVLKIEHKIFPLVISWFCEHRLKLVSEKVMFDGKALNESELLYSDN
jgi:phosphoribosylglycinamide formyltransferase-1